MVFVSLPLFPLLRSLSKQCFQTSVLRFTCTIVHTCTHVGWLGEFYVNKISHHDVMYDNWFDYAVLYTYTRVWFLHRAIRLTGPFVTMIYSMITGDMLTFGIIYTIVLFGFSQSFYVLYKGFPGVKSSLYHSYPTTWMALFQITLGDYNVSSP